MNLPPEILDYILSLLQSNKAALRACCESHTILSQLAEPYLYSNIRLEWIDGGILSGPEFTSPSDLSTYLSKKPHIAHYIRDLKIQFGARSQSHMNHLLRQTSAILPMLSSLRTITFDLFPPYEYRWKSLPESFRQAFLNCLHSPSMQKVSISRFVDFPFMHVLSGAFKTIIRLAVSKAFVSQAIDLDNTTYSIQSHTFKCLSISSCDNLFLATFITQIEQQGLQFRSLEFSAPDAQSLRTFSRLLTFCSNSLISLDLAIDAIHPPVEHGDMVLVALSILPHLERLTIRARLEYNSRSGPVLLSPISHLKQLFTTDFSSGRPTSSLKHITLDFNCIPVQDQIPSISSEVVCLDVGKFLLSISAFAKSSPSTPIQVDLYLRGSQNTSEPNWRTVSMPLHSPLSQCEELMDFVTRKIIKRGR